MPERRYTFSFVSSATSTAKFNDPLNEAERLTIFAMLEGKDRLLQHHEAAWNKLWQSDIVVEGDIESQRTFVSLCTICILLRAKERLIACHRWDFPDLDTMAMFFGIQNFGCTRRCWCFIPKLQSPCWSIVMTTGSCQAKCIFSRIQGRDVSMGIIRRRNRRHSCLGFDGSIPASYIRMCWMGILEILPGYEG